MDRIFFHFVTKHPPDGQQRRRKLKKNTTVVTFSITVSKQLCKEAYLGSERPELITNTSLSGEEGRYEARILNKQIKSYTSDFTRRNSYHSNNDMTGIVDTLVQ